MKLKASPFPGQLHQQKFDLSDIAKSHQHPREFECAQMTPIEAWGRPEKKKQKKNIALINVPASKTRAVPN